METMYVAAQALQTSPNQEMWSRREKWFVVNLRMHLLRWKSFEAQAGADEEVQDHACRLSSSFVGRVPRPAGYTSVLFIWDTQPAAESMSEGAP